MSELDRNKTSFVERWLQQQTVAEHGIETSIVIPAYNEGRRLPPTLIDAIDFLDSRKSGYEIIVVDDGSSDETAEVVEKFEKIRPQIRLIHIPKNQGKGFAVRTGVLNAKGSRILFADADGATPIREIERLEAAILGGADVAIGSRVLHGEDTKVVTQWYKKLRGRAFHSFVRTLLIPDIEDTQCGFKMFTARAGKFLFEIQKAERFSFDVEVLYLAKNVGMKVVEIPVNWTNIPGSKVHPIIDPLKMLGDLFVFKWRHRKITKGAFGQ